MNYLNKIVRSINASLEQSCFKKKPFQNRYVVDVCEVFQRNENEITQSLPGYINHDGEITYVGPDDEYNLIIYHKVNSIFFSKLVKSAYGDSRGLDTQTASMSMIVFCKRDAVRITNTDMALLLQANFPEAASADLLQQLQFKKCSMAIGNAVLNNLQVFQEEYQGVGYFLKPEQFLLKLNYSIESTFLKECFNTCCNANNTNYLDTENGQDVLAESGSGVLV